MNLPTLYKKTSTGAIQEWEIRVDEVPDAALGYSAGEIVTIFGQKLGKKQVAKDLVVHGKNIGKANETTALEQAEAEAKSQWEKKKKKGYVESVEDANAGKVDSIIAGGVDVMLAHKFSEQGSKIKYPAYVQPKLDGHRCVAVIKDGHCTLWSRTRKPILGVPHIQRALEELFPSEDVVLDGELYNHDYKDKFEQLSSFIRQTTPKDGHEVVQYWVYDLVAPDESFKWRIEWLEDQIGWAKPPIVCVETWEISDESDLMDYFATFLGDGFEGAIVRNSDSPYVGKRSYDLQKVKEFDDSEFEILGVEGGRGKMADKGVFVCATPEGQEFKAKMVGDLDELKKYLDNPDDYIGKMVTVKYQGLTGKNGVPRFPVAMRIRENA